MINAWTDYPFTFLGDTAGKIAPIRMVEVLAYDRDKCCRIRVDGQLDLIKRCYLYKQRGRCGKVPVLSTRQLKKLPLVIYGEPE